MTVSLISSFRKKLLSWHRNIDRDMPWKKTKDPYKIWLSEVILQQTRVAQGVVYYNKFVRQYPNVNLLAAASEDDILSLWKGLGYYSRARNLHAAAKRIVNQHGANFPKSYEEIIGLSGVGTYTAAAISSFAYELPYAVVDGNVYRVLSRVFGIKIPIDSSKGKKSIKSLAQKCLDKAKPGDYNQAIMDFGALQCLPKSPSCHSCTMSKLCEARIKDLVLKLPVKAKKIKVRVRFFNFLIYRNKKQFLIEKRTENDIWKGLYQFPLLESKKQMTHQELAFKLEKNRSSKNVSLIGAKKQRLTHQLIHATFFLINRNPIGRDQQWKTLREIKNLGLPKLVDEFISELASMTKLDEDND